MATVNEIAKILQAIDLPDSLVSISYNRFIDYGENQIHLTKDGFLELYSRYETEPHGGKEDNMVKLHVMEGGVRIFCLDWIDG